MKLERYEQVLIIEHEDKPCLYEQIIWAEYNERDDGEVAQEYEFVDWVCQGSC